MLTVRYGPDRRENTRCALEALCALPEGSRGVLIVPEQDSHDAEWALCQHGGDSISRRAEVLSFTRLATRVFSVTGGAAAPVLDQSGRMIAMAGALELLRPRLRLYGAHIAKPEFLEQLLQVVDEFHAYGLDAAAVRRAKAELSEPLSAKLEELCLILELYDTVCSRSSMDPSMRLDRLRDALWESDWAEGVHVVVDGFSDFTAQELSVLEVLARKAADLTVWLCCDSLRGGQSVFAVPRATAHALRDLAGRAGLRFRDAAQPGKRREGALAHLAQSLFASRPEPWPAQTEDVILLDAADAHEACSLALARIQALIRGGSRWREIGLAYTDASVYEPLLEAMLDRYRMPAYFSGTRDLLRHGLIRAVVYALEAAACGMEAESVCEYLRSGCAPVTRDDADRIENYAFIWNLRGSRWDTPFHQIPTGPSSDPPTPEALEAMLEPLNRAREAAVLPLLRLRDALRSAANTAEQVEALERFLEQLGLEKTLETQAQREASEGRIRQARELTQLYELLLSTMEQIYGVVGDSVRTPEEFCRLFRAAAARRQRRGIAQRRRAPAHEGGGALRCAGRGGADRSGSADRLYGPDRPHAESARMLRSGGAELSVSAPRVDLPAANGSPRPADAGGRVGRRSADRLRRRAAGACSAAGAGARAAHAAKPRGLRTGQTGPERGRTALRQQPQLFRLQGG